MMEEVQQGYWAEAQKIEFSVDLVEATKKHLNFLSLVDGNRYLYEDASLQRAIYRYNGYWLPLLSKHLDQPLSEHPLVVPLDCEWIWHCHRLNPLRYKLDCEKLFGKVLGNQNVISSAEATSKSETEEIWNEMYPEEPYELDLNKPSSLHELQQNFPNKRFTTYNLVDAVKRQTSFVFQVTRPYMQDDIFLQEAVARYKGYLHLIRTVEKKRMKVLCVPLIDMDLIWHTHQLNADAYTKDMREIIGRVLHHNDMISDEVKESGSYETTKQWEDMYGFSYWKAGAMNRGDPPTPVTDVPIVQFNDHGLGFNVSAKCGMPFHFRPAKAIEVCLEFVQIKNIPNEHQMGHLIVSFSKQQPDKYLNTKIALTISSESGDKRVANFQCEPTGEFLFELMSCSSSNEMIPNLLGSCSLSMQKLIANSKSKLSVDEWIPVKLLSDFSSSDQPFLHVNISFTPPSPAPQEFQLVISMLSSEAENRATVMDGYGNEVFSLHMRDIIKGATKCTSGVSKEILCITKDGEKYILAEYMGGYWTIMGTHGSFKLPNNLENHNEPIELVGYKKVKLFCGMRLDFEPRHCDKPGVDEDFKTVVEFSADYPYGRAITLLNLVSKTIKVTDEWMILPGIALSFILSKNSTKKTQSHKLTEEVVNKEKIEDEMANDGLILEQKGGYGYASDCAKCFSCGVTAGSYSRIGDFDKTNSPTYEIMGQKGGFTSDCAKCFSCGVTAGNYCGDNTTTYKIMGQEGRFTSDCAKCFSCGVTVGN